MLSPISFGMSRPPFGCCRSHRTIDRPPTFDPAKESDSPATSVGEGLLGLNQSPHLGCSSITDHDATILVISVTDEAPIRVLSDSPLPESLDLHMPGGELIGLQ